MTIELFCGYDERESIGFHVFLSSVIEHASVPVSIHALDARGLKVGSNAFTFSRFLVPWLLGFQGHAIYVDACDMLMLDDVAELDAFFDPEKAVQCVKHRTYHTKHKIKYLGTSMQCPNVDYEKKNWTSCMLINAAHPAWAKMNPAAIEDAKPLDLLQLRFIDDADIGELPDRWNRLVDEGGAVDGAALLHWTTGLPAFPHYVNAPGADLWRAQRDRMMEIA